MTDGTEYFTNTTMTAEPHVTHKLKHTYTHKAIPLSGAAEEVQHWSGHLKRTSIWQLLVLPELWKYKASTMNDKIFGPTKGRSGRTSSASPAFIPYLPTLTLFPLLAFFLGTVGRTSEQITTYCYSKCSIGLHFLKWVLSLSLFMWFFVQSFYRFQIIHDSYNMNPELVISVVINEFFKITIGLG